MRRKCVFVVAVVLVGVVVVVVVVVGQVVGGMGRGVGWMGVECSAQAGWVVMLW